MRNLRHTFLHKNVFSICLKFHCFYLNINIHVQKIKVRK